MSKIWTLCTFPFQMALRAGFGDIIWAQIILFNCHPVSWTRKAWSSSPSPSSRISIAKQRFGDFSVPPWWQACSHLWLRISQSCTLHFPVLQSKLYLSQTLFGEDFENCAWWWSPYCLLLAPRYLNTYDTGSDIRPKGTCCFHGFRILHCKQG